jgi:hypothetical protein
MSAKPTNNNQRSLWLVLAIVSIIALTWALASDQVWEDFYITFRASRNLAEGNGLTFTPGERVHSFTSPLGVLLPAATFLATGNSSVVVALWLFRLLSIAALAGAVALLWKTLSDRFATKWPAVLLVALLATDSKTLSFSINGMETAILLLFAAWAIWALVTRPAHRILHLGAAWGGLMWTRPDACVYIAAMGAGTLLFAPGAATGDGFWKHRLACLRELLAAGALCAIVYLPWFVWAWWYYGSPIPHTIVAKGLMGDRSLAHLVTAVVHFPEALVAGQSTLVGTFLPAYGTMVGWPAFVQWAAALAAWVPLLVFLLPFARRDARFASFVYFVGHCYLTVMIVSPVPWYLPIVTWFGLVALALCFGQALDLLRQLGSLLPARAEVPAMRRTLGALAVALVLGEAAFSVVMCRQAYLEMKISENMVRKAIGLWLHDHAASPKDSVLLEPLGFIGYFSDLKMFDFPGLCSTEMVAARQRAKLKSYPDCWAELIHDLHPDWLVLRPREQESIAAHDPALFSLHYEYVRTFDATAAAHSVRWVPVPEFLDCNRTFTIYRARKPGGAAIDPNMETTLLTLGRFSRKEGDISANGNQLLAHAPSLLETKLQPGTSILCGQFGIFEGAYAKPLPDATDGAVFRVELVHRDNQREILFERFLNPATAPSDRGLQSFAIKVPDNMEGTVSFTVGPGPAGNPSYDWAYWESLAFGQPRNVQ